MKRIKKEGGLKARAMWHTRGEGEKAKRAQRHPQQNLSQKQPLEILSLYYRVLKENENQQEAGTVLSSLHKSWTSPGSLFFPPALFWGIQQQQRRWFLLCTPPIIPLLDLMFQKEASISMSKSKCLKEIIHLPHHLDRRELLAYSRSVIGQTSPLQV